MSAQPGVTPEMAMGPSRWDRFLYWSSRHHAMPEFDAWERDYKVVVAERVAAARDAFFDGNPDWIDLLHHAIAAKPNNLTSWRQTRPLEEWFRADRNGAELALRFLWNPDLEVHQRFNQFAEVAIHSGQKAPVSETSFLHLAMGVTEFPPFRATPLDRAMDLTGYPLPRETGIKSGDIGRRYEHSLRFFDNMIKRASERGLILRDRLDAQGVSWVVTQWLPHADWSDADQAAFRDYQGEAKSRKAS